MAPVKTTERPALQLVRKVEVDRSRDALLTDFGKKTLEDRYLLAGESYQDMFARVATAYADDADHAQRVYDYISQLWFMPGHPGAVQRRRRPRPADLLLPERRVRLAGRHPERLERERGAGLQRRRHRHLLGRRPLHRREGEGRGPDLGIIPFIRVMDSLTLAISQGSLRRGSAAVYLDIHHPRSRSSSRSGSRRATSTASR
jgi:ribonucleoside-diphosphate reductase alpha chain